MIIPSSLRSVCLFILLTVSATLSFAIEVQRILPMGEVVTQTDSINITFSEPMVALGEFEKTANLPVQISPSVACEWRWISTTSLSCKLSEKAPLKMATEYRVIVKKGFRGLKGHSTVKDVGQTFRTQRPQVSYTGFRRWLGPGMPVIMINFNLEVTAGSLKKTLFLTQNGVPVRTRVIYKDIEKLNFYDTDGAEVLLRAIKRAADDKETSATWLIVPEDDLQSNAKMSLAIKPGLMSTAGPLPGTEQREIVGFQTYPEFSYVGFSCREEGQPVPAGGDPSACNPLKEMGLRFTAPVLGTSLQKQCTIAPFKDKAAMSTYLEQIGDSAGYTNVPSNPLGFRLSMMPLTVARTEFTFSCTEKLTDIFGRTLKQPLVVKIKTAAREPTFSLAYEVGVLEKSIDSEIPIYLTNLGQVNVEYSKLTATQRQTNQSLKLDVQNIKDISYGVPLKVRTMLGGQSGAVYTSVSTPEHPLLPQNLRAKGFYQVTPFYVHFKEGHFNSVIWVKDLATGKPVEGAQITLMKSTLAMIAEPHQETKLGLTGKDGRGELPGFSEYDPDLKHREYSENEEKWMLVIKKGSDIAILPLSYDFTAWAHWSSGEGSYTLSRPKHGHVRVWGTSPQGVYRGGDTIDYKIYVRDQDQNRFIQPLPGPYTLSVFDPTGKEVFKQKGIKLNDFGSFSGSFKTTKSSTVGWYRFQVNAAYLKGVAGSSGSEGPSEGDGDSGEGEGAGNPSATLPGLNSHQVLVTDFTPAPFRPENELDRSLYMVGDKMNITTRARLHSGGPYADAKARLNITLSPSGFTPEPQRVLTDFDFACGMSESAKAISEKEVKLDARGDQQEVLAVTEKDIQCGRLVVTSDVADDRGKYFSAVKSAKYFSVSRLIGLRQEKFIYNENETAKIDYIVVDPTSKIQKGAPVSIRVERQEVKKVRIKGSGNAYLEESKTEWVFISGCEKASSDGPATCAIPLKQPGYYRIEASVKDSKGQINKNTSQAFVTGKGTVTWDEGEGGGLKIVPEDVKPKVGDVAKYLVQNPFPGGEALITIERYGILKSWTEKFTSSTPVVKFPITEDMLPGFHLSITVFSPRVAAPLGQGQVDLGKPAFKMGYIKVEPDNPVKQLSVQAQSDAKEYRPGGNVKITVSAKPRSSRPAEKIEFAVAVLDEAVFDLIKSKNEYFDIYKGFYSLEELDVKNFSLLMQLVGRQKLEKKGANAGGDGAGLAMRSLFKYVAYWNPSLKADGKGQAQAEFKLPDNLTGWRILVIAATSTDQMGLGQSVFQSNRPTEVRPVLPNLVREGDSFKAAFTVMNRTDKARTLKVVAQASGILSGDPKTHRIEQSIEAASYKRNIIEIPLSAAFLKESTDVSEGKIQFVVSAGDSIDKDGLKVELPVQKKRVLLTEAVYGTTTENKVREQVAIPKDIYVDIGNLSVTSSPTVIGNVQSAFQYLRNYPYLCWEQRLTKGVFASSYQSLKPYLGESFLWPESRSLVKSLLEDAAAFQAPNGGMCYYKAADDLVSPYLSAYTALAFQWLKDRGEKLPSVQMTKLDAYLLNMLRTDVSPSFYSKGMSATVRSVALAALAKSKAVKASDVSRYRAQLKTMDLFGKAHFLQAALTFPETEAAAKEALSLILGTANETGGKFHFTEAMDLGWERIHSSELRTQCAILSAISAAAAKPWAEKQIGDVPFKMVRAITQTRKGTISRWENTQENMFCTEALINYSRRYESVKPNMTVTASFAGQKMGEGKLSDFRQKPLIFTHPLQPRDVGLAAAVDIQRAGAGRLYYNASLSFAPKEDFKKARNAGIEIRREYMVERGGKFLLLTPPYKIKQGELVRVNLYISVPSARDFVVVDDAVPGGLEVLNEDLGGTSAVDAAKKEQDFDKNSYMWEFKDWHYFSSSYSGFYFNEIRHDSVRFYSEYLEKGNYQLSYVAQAIAKGQFAILPASAEEMYDPDVFGKTPATQIEVTAP
jgi:uncharacterized protein YfaS (alpha-2-macroglobulin family)